MQLLDERAKGIASPGSIHRMAHGCLTRQQPCTLGHLPPSPGVFRHAKRISGSRLAVDRTLAIAGEKIGPLFEGAK
jgi:hypothetical protein